MKFHLTILFSMLAIGLIVLYVLYLLFSIDLVTVLIVVVLAVSAALISRSALSPRIIKLTNDLKMIEETEELSSRIEVTGADEVSTLSKTINELLDTFEDLQNNMQKSEERYRNIVLDQADLIFRFTSEGRITYMNDAMGKLFHLGNEKAAGQNAADRMSKEMIVELRTQLESLSSTDIFATLESTYTTPEGEVRWLQWTASKIKSSSPDIKEYQAVGRDITEIKDAEMILEQINKKLNLLSTITRHDILNQIMAISGFLQLIEISAKEEKTQEYVSKMGKSLDRLKQQIEFTRQYQNMGVNKPQWIQASSCFAKASSNLRIKDISLSVSLDGLELFADPLLEKVFYNLIDNSIRHGKHISLLKISHAENEKGLKVVYEDNGVGVHQDEKQKIFEPGYGENTGYGLFLVKEILGITGMIIRETGEPGKGARFEIEVPKGKYHLSRKKVQIGSNVPG